MFLDLFLLEKKLKLVTDSSIRKIIHLDMDAFFASVEQRDHPELRGRPVAVGGARERGVVAAASYEARQFGVRSAMSSSIALRKCPELVFVPPRFAVYKEVSRQIRAIFAEYTALIEPVALDEAYLDVTENLPHMASATQIAREIRAKILVETGLTASAGISYNKFLAKLASDYRKPNGQFVVRPAQGLAFVETLAVGQFHGDSFILRLRVFRAVILRIRRRLGEGGAGINFHEGQRNGRWLLGGPGLGLHERGQARLALDELLREAHQPFGLGIPPAEMLPDLVRAEERKMDDEGKHERHRDGMAPGQALPAAGRSPRFHSRHVRRMPHVCGPGNSFGGQQALRSRRLDGFSGRIIGRKSTSSKAVCRSGLPQPGA